MKPSLKKEFLTQRVEKKMLFMHHILRIMLLVMSAIVLYDSFLFNIPLYFMTFFIVGWAIGRVYRFIYTIEHQEEDNSYTLIIKKIGIVITVFCILLRFVLGKWIEDALHIIWYADAIYLFLIGLNYAKWRSIIKKLDELVYSRLLRA